MQQAQRNHQNIVIGVDLGGTTMSAGAVRGSTIIAGNKMDTDRSRPALEIISDIIMLIDSVKGTYALDAIGIGVPTPAGPGTETFLPAQNLPALDHYPLKAQLSEHFNVPVFLENDANCMTVGEYHAGALTGVRSGVCLTLGTGLGCGIIMDGSLMRGSRYYAGEIWNVPITPDTILEDTVSIEALKCLAESYTGSRIEPHELHERYRAGDSKAHAVWRLYGQAVGRVVSMVVTLIDPERIIIGGGIAGAFEAFQDSMIEAVTPVYGEGIADIIKPARLSDHAAIIGAALLARDTAKDNTIQL